MPLLDGGPPEGGPGTDAQGAPDLGPADLSAGPSGTFLLATGAHPILDGVTRDGRALGYHDGTDQWAVATSHDISALKLAQNLDNSGAVVSNNTVLTLHDYHDCVDSLSAWVPGDATATELEDRAQGDRNTLCASPDDKFVAWVHVSADCASGDVIIRRRAPGSQPVSPVALRGIDLPGCPLTRLTFVDSTHLVVQYCPLGGPPPRPQVALANAETGGVTPLSVQPKEKVDQVLVVPGQRVLWVNMLSSDLDPSALKSATIDGLAVQLLENGIPTKEMAQLSLSEDGTHVFYLMNGTRALRRVQVAGKEPGATLTTDPVDRIAGISPDGSTVAVTRGTGPMLRLSLINTASKTSVDVPRSGGISVPSGAEIFTRDSQLVLFLSDAGTLTAFPTTGPLGAMRTDVLPRVQSFAPVVDSKVLALHDASMGQAVASLIDARSPTHMADKDHGLNPTMSGSWALSSDRTRLLYVKGNSIYVTTLP